MSSPIPYMPIGKHVNMHDEVVVITGGTAGVGRAVAQRFARAGARVAVLARGKRGLDATEEELRRLGAERVVAVRCDVSDPAQVEHAAERVEAELGPIDVWINNAMVTVFGRMLDITPDELRRVTDVTYHGYVWGTRAAVARMRGRNRGTIVQVGSALAYRAIPLQSAYCAAKHAVRGFTDSLRSELQHEGIGVELCMVQLPAINTPQFDWGANHMEKQPQPVPPIFQPEIAAEAIFFAAHHPRREIWLGRPTVEAVLGNKLAPGLLDRYLARTGYTGQLTQEPATGSKNNLFEPVDGDFGAHGRFDERARERDVIARATTWLGAAGVQAAAVTVALVTVGAVTMLLRKVLA